MQINHQYIHFLKTYCYCLKIDHSPILDNKFRQHLFNVSVMSPLSLFIHYFFKQLMDEIIEKAKQGSPVGREKMLES